MKLTIEITTQGPIKNDNGENEYYTTVQTSLDTDRGCVGTIVSAEKVAYLLGMQDKILKAIAEWDPSLSQSLGLDPQSLKDIG